MGDKFREQKSNVEAVSTDSQVHRTALIKAPLYMPAELVYLIIKAIGDDPERQGLYRTPDRVVASWAELFSGYGKTPQDVFSSHSDEGFELENYDQMITLKDVDFYSTCEHHMLPFSGLATVSYIPDTKYGKLLGISKLARLIDIYSRRLQNQERITAQVADALVSLAKPQGVGVKLVAAHHCMLCRGVHKQSSKMITTALRGNFHKSDIKAEFLSYAK